MYKISKEHLIYFIFIKIKYVLKKIIMILYCKCLLTILNIENTIDPMNHFDYLQYLDIFRIKFSFKFLKIVCNKNNNNN